MKISFVLISNIVYGHINVTLKLNQSQATCLAYALYLELNAVPQRENMLSKNYVFKKLNFLN